MRGSGGTVEGNIQLFQESDVGFDQFESNLALVAVHTNILTPFNVSPRWRVKIGVQFWKLAPSFTTAMS